MNTEKFQTLQYSNVLSLLQETTAEHEDAVALQPVNGNPITYRSLQRRVDTFAASLRACGVTGGEHASRVAIVMANGIDLSLVILGTCCTGVALPFNTGYKANEYRNYFVRTRTEFLIVSHNDNGPAVAIAKQAGIRILRLGQDISRVDIDPSIIAAKVPKHLEPRQGDIAIILLTSGSTGLGKSVPLTHGNLCASSRSVCQSVSLGPKDRCLSMWEQFHIGGVVDLLLAPLASGGEIISTDGFDAELFFELLSSHEPTWFQGVPTTLGELCRYARVNESGTLNSSLRFIRSVAAALQEPLMLEIEERFRVPVIQTFGMTEAAPLITSNCLPPGKRKPESAGISWGSRVSIMDASGHPLPFCEHGHIAIRGDNVFTGYDGDNLANAESFKNGWFYTGDLGYIDEDNYLFLTGRAKEIINRGGEKISPAEIDRVLIEHPAIAQAAAFGIPHLTLGEEVAAAIVLKPDLTITQTEIQVFVAKRLAPFKHPRSILFLNDLPRCSVGKVRRRELACRIADTAVNAPYREPMNAIESLLLQLWAIELESDSIGVNDNFAALGGDSLSSVRIHIATELIFNIKIPDGETSHFDTVENMSAALIRMGVSANKLPNSHLISHDTPLKIPLVEEVISATDQLMTGKDASFHTLYNCQTKSEFRLLSKTKETFDTPQKLHAWLYDKPSVISRLFLSFRSPTAIKLAYRRRQYRHEFMKEINQSIKAMDWGRRPIDENDYLFSTSTVSARKKTLICAFSGNKMRLMMPIYKVLLCLDPDQYDLLLLTDPDRKHHSGGNQGPDSKLELTARRLNKFACNEGYRKVVTFGTSAGGLPAIGIALLNGWPKALALGADRPTSHTHFAVLIEQALSQFSESPATTVTVSFAAHNQRDNEAGAEIKQLLPFSQLLPDERFKKHSIAYSLYQEGELKHFLQEYL